MTKMIFVNLSVQDLAAATRCYEAIGCTKNEQFSDEQSASMVWSETITFQLMTPEKFATFAHKPIGDAHATCQMLLALSCDTPAAVDSMVEAAGQAGGKTDVRPIMDLGWLYNRAFEDTDGHVFEALWVDMNATG